MNMHYWVAAFLAAVIIGLLVLGALSVFQCLRTRSWPRVDATIVTSSIEPEGYDPISYGLKITYCYTVDGKSYIGHQISAGWQSAYAWSWRAKRAARKYAVGISVDAFHSPQDPTTAVLETGLGSAPLVLLGMVTVLMFVAWYQLALGMLASV